jgi:hypothetical protein
MNQAVSRPGQALSRGIRLAVPIGSILMLLLIAMTIALPSDITTLFIPVYIFMVVVYVFSSIFLFKTVMDKETPTRSP